MAREREDAEHAGRRRPRRDGAATTPADAGRGRPSAARRVGDDDLDPAEVVGGARARRRRTRRVAVVGEHRVGERAEGRRDRRLVARLDPDVLGHEAADAGEPGGDQRGRAVLLVERQRQGAGAGGEGVALALQRVQLLAQPLDLALGLEDRRPARARRPRRGRSRRRRPSRPRPRARRTRRGPARGARSAASSAFCWRSTSPRTAASRWRAASAWPLSLEISRSCRETRALCAAISSSTASSGRGRARSRPAPRPSAASASATTLRSRSTSSRASSTICGRDARA